MRCSRTWHPARTRSRPPGPDGRPPGPSGCPRQSPAPPPGTPARAARRHSRGRPFSPAHRVQRRHLGHHMPAQRRVAPADQLHTRTAPPRHRDKAPRGHDIGLGRVRFLHAARVGQDEAGRSRADRRRRVRLLLQDSHHLNAVHCLVTPFGSSSSTPSSKPSAARIARMDARRPSSSGRGSGSPPSTFGRGGQTVTQSSAPYRVEYRDVRPPYSTAHAPNHPDTRHPGTAQAETALREPW